MDTEKSKIQQIFSVVAVIVLLITGGCASSKMTAKLSGEKIFEAEKAVSAARDGNASVNAKNELGVAEEKLAKAKASFGKEEYDEASNLAELAIVDAGYAGEKAATQKKLNELEEMKKSNEALRQEIHQIYMKK